MTSGKHGFSSALVSALLLSVSVLPANAQSTPDPDEEAARAQVQEFLREQEALVRKAMEEISEPINTEAPPEVQTDPALQSRSAILKRFGVDTRKLPADSVVKRIVTKDGRFDELQMQIPAMIHMDWTAPNVTSATCDITLLVNRTADLPGMGGLPANSQFVHSPVFVGDWGGAVFSPIVDGVPVSGTGNPWPDYGDPYPSRMATMSVAPPTPGCESLAALSTAMADSMDIFGTIRREVANAEEAQGQDAAKMAEQIRNVERMMGAMPKAPAGTRVVSPDELRRLSCYGGPFRVRYVSDARPESFALTFGEDIRDADDEDCPVRAAHGYINADAEPDEDLNFYLVAASPEPQMITGPDGKSFACTNNDPVAPLVRFDFSDSVDPETLRGNVKLEKHVSADVYEPVDAEFEVAADSSVIISPGVQLEPMRIYRVTVIGGKAGVRGYGDDQILDENAVIEFQTAAGSNDEELRKVLGEVVDLGIYQVVRDQPLTMGKPTYARTELVWPAKETPDAERYQMPESVCMSVDVATAESSSSSQKLSFTSVPFPFPRSDLATDDVKRRGYHKALSGPIKPTPGSNPEKLFSATLKPYNFTSAADPVVEPEIVHEKDKPIKVLNDRFWLSMVYYTAQFIVHPKDRLLVDDEDAYIALNGQSAELGKEIFRRRKELSDTLAAFTPSAGMDVSWGGMHIIPVQPMPGGSPKKKKDYVVEQVVEYYEANILPECTSGSQMCAVTLPYPNVPAQARYKPATRGRGFTIGTEILEKAPASLNLALVHEIGHTFSVAHAPNDFNSEPEQDRIYDTLKGQRVRWPGIDSIRVWGDGRVGFKHSQDGNSENQSLWPFMYNTVPQPEASALPTDQYAQMLKAMQNRTSRNPAYYGAHPEGALSSKRGLDDTRWRTGEMARYDAHTPVMLTLPAYDYYAPADAPGSDRPGVVIGGVFSVEGSDVALEFRPVLRKANGMKGSMTGLSAGGFDINVSLEDASGAVLSSDTFQVAPGGSKDAPGFRLRAFLQLASNQLDDVSRITYSRVGGGEIASVDVPVVDELTNVRAVRNADGSVSLNWASRSDSRAEIRILRVDSKGRNQIIYSGLDLGETKIDGDVVGAIETIDASGDLYLVRTNGLVETRKALPALLRPGAKGNDQLGTELPSSPAASVVPEQPAPVEEAPAEVETRESATPAAAPPLRSSAQCSVTATEIEQLIDVQLKDLSAEDRAIYRPIYEELRDPNYPMEIICMLKTEYLK